MTTRMYMKQRPPVRKMGRAQRLDYRTNPVNGIPWANWADYSVQAPEAPEGSPTSAWLKADIVTWMIAEGLIADETEGNALTKAELLELIPA